MGVRLHSFRRRQAGFSLVELMISMVIGLVIIGAMFAAYVGSGLSSRNTRAMSQITEDASIAFSVMRSAIAATSYIVPANSNADGFVSLTGGDGRASTLSGCNNEFSDPDEALGALSCAEGDGPHAIAVSYEADAQNSAVNADGDPLDCLGNEVPESGGVRPAYQRFFVKEGGLHCLGPGNDASAALVDNVVNMQIQYGVGCDTTGLAPACVDQGGVTADKQGGRVVRYMDAAAIRDEAGGTPDNLFKWVLSVRLCVTVASADNVLDASTKYVNCSGDSVDPPGGDGDRRMYRSFTSTIVLHNRLEGTL
jgi:type IV pilus assembly protein PilW